MVKYPLLFIRFSRNQSHLRALNLSRTKATGANIHRAVCAVYNGLNLADVGLPSSVCLTVGVGNIVSKNNTLTAYATLSHFYTSSILPKRAFHKSTHTILTYKYVKCKCFLKKSRKNLKFLFSVLFPSKTPCFEEIYL